LLSFDSVLFDASSEKKFLSIFPTVACLTPVAGLIFETFLERFFWKDFSGEKLLPVQLCSH